MIVYFCCCLVQRNEINGVSGYDSPLVRLYWAGDNLGGAIKGIWYHADFAEFGFFAKFATLHFWNFPETRNE